MRELASSLIPSRQAVFAPLAGGEGVIVDTDTAFYYGLNRTAAFLWSQIQAAPDVSAQALAEALCGRFEVTPQQAAGDVRAFLGQLQRYGLVQVPAG
jgi:PqqD family protein of HPr-rel-A system